MNPILHDIKHQYQPSPTSCGQTALSMILAHFGQYLTPAELENLIPQTKDENGQDAGTVNQQIATWCIGQGYRATIYTFDTQIIDQSWRDLNTQQIIERLQAGIETGRPAEGLGERYSDEYRQAYIDFLQTGGKLVIRPHATSELLYSLLQKGPILPAVLFGTLHGRGKFGHDSKPDDVSGKSGTHSIVIYGVDEQGNFLVADPIEKPGLHVVEAERMVAAISSAQTECDNLLIQITK